MKIEIHRQAIYQIEFEDLKKALDYLKAGKDYETLSKSIIVAFSDAWCSGIGSETDKIDLGKYGVYIRSQIKNNDSDVWICNTKDLGKITLFRDDEEYYEDLTHLHW